MKNFLLSGLLVAAIVIIGGCSSQQAPTPTPAPNSQIQPSAQSSSTSNQAGTSSSTSTTSGSGKDIYDKNCAGCHGAAGVGGAAPALNNEKRTQAQVTDITKKGVGSMPGYASKLSDMQIQAAAQYVANLK